VADRDVQTIVDTILKHARTGAVGTARCSCCPSRRPTGFRTGEAGEEVPAGAPGPGHGHAVGDGGGGGRNARKAMAGAAHARERLRAVHLQMMDAVLGGEGLARVAQLASEAAGGPVAVVVPRLGVCAMAPDGPEPTGLRAWVSTWSRDRAPGRPGQVLGRRAHPLR